MPSANFTASFTALLRKEVFVFARDLTTWTKRERARTGLPAARRRVDAAARLAAFLEGREAKTWALRTSVGSVFILVL